VEVEDLLYTLATMVGIDPAKEHHSSIGRPVRNVNGGKLIPGLLS
jgi:hypothetical protein